MGPCVRVTVVGFARLPSDTRSVPHAYQPLTPDSEIGARAAHERDGDGAPRPSVSIGVVARDDPEDPAAFSGVPASIIAAFRAFGCPTVPISVGVPGALGALAWRAAALSSMSPFDVLAARHTPLGLRNVGQLSRPVRFLAAHSVRRQLAAAPSVQGLVQLEGELAAPRGLPMVTFHDSTLAQAARSYDWPHLRGVSERQLRRNIAWQRRAYESAVACCATTRWVAESLAADYAIPPEKIHVVGRGPNHQPRPLRDRDWSTPRFLFVGLDWTRKNGQGLLEAFAQVRRQVPEATLDVVGDHPPLAQAGVTGHGLLPLADPQAQARMRHLYETATLFVLPSLHEPLGLSHIEAGAAGIASIGTIRGGAATFIADAGRCVDPGDPQALAGAMLELSRAEVARELGARALARAQLFTWRLVVERLLRALDLPGIATESLAEYL